MDNKENKARPYNTQLIISVCCLCAAAAVVVIAAYSFITKAWMTHNRRTDNAGLIAAETLDNSVFIEPVGASNAAQPSGSFANGAEAVLSGNLYPISTIDCENWYCAGVWDTTSKHYTSYIKTHPAADDSAHPDRHNYSVDDGAHSKSYTAYNSCSFWIYTDEGSRDIYFDPAGPVEISIDEDKNAVTHRAVYLKQALRVAVQIDGSLIVYAPSAESGAGNSQGSQPNTLYAINAGGALTPVGEAQHFYTELTSYSAIEIEPANPSSSSGEAEGVYGAGENKLCRAGDIASGQYKKMTVFVWLEGTDAQAVRGKSNNADGINIKINLVGSDIGG